MRELELNVPIMTTRSNKKTEMKCKINKQVGHWTVCGVRGVGLG